VKACTVQKQGEVSDIPFPNTSADPGAMMIVHFYAAITLTAMKRTWWAENLTRFTVA
jgi:hypothetical protein